MRVELKCPECGKPSLEDDFMVREIRENPYYLAKYIPIGARSIMNTLGVVKRFTCEDRHEFFWQDESMKPNL